MKTILQIETNTEILRQKARELSVDEIKSVEIQTLIQEMKQIMRDAPGVGLAAPQIGISLQIAVIEDPKERLQEIPAHILADRERTPVEFQVIINPKIRDLSGKTNYFFEGCLSIKNRARVTPRKDIIRVDYLDENANEQSIVAQGWHARILQHEIDHLQGRLYIDCADSRSEIEMNDENRKKWMGAMGSEIIDYYKEKCLC